jgi:SAM-dependent methyltransferase
MPRERAGAAGVQDPFANGQFPLCPQTHHKGVCLLFDLATLVMVLDCRPGDRVLDVGAGSGFSSEMLARFGYNVVAIDPDHRALRHNLARGRFDRERIQGRRAAVEAVAERLPFADQSFDGIVCMNVLHHIPELGLTLDELARVLRPGCRLVLSEPGLNHLASPETRRAAEQGEHDRPFDVVDFGLVARHRGFERVMIVPTVHPSQTLLPIDQIDFYTAGTHPIPTLTPRGAFDNVRGDHPFAALVREGTRPKTSRFPGVLKATLAVEERAVRGTPGGTVAMAVRAANAGDSTWLAEPSPFGGHVTFACKLLTSTGRLVTDSLGRTRLGVDVAPGDEASANLQLALPEDLEPGEYRLEFDMVDEFVCWFSEASPTSPSTVAAVALTIE